MTDMEKSKEYHVEVYEKKGHWRSDPNSKAGWKRKKSFETRPKAETAAGLFRMLWPDGGKTRIVEV